VEVDPTRTCELLVDECRRRVQNETVGHRGRKDDPLNCRSYSRSSLSPKINTNSGPSITRNCEARPCTRAAGVTTVKTLEVSWGSSTCCRAGPTRWPPGTDVGLCRGSVGWCAMAIGESGADHRCGGDVREPGASGQVAGVRGLAAERTPSPNRPAQTTSSVAFSVRLIADRGAYLVAAELSAASEVAARVRVCFALGVGAAVDEASRPTTR